MSLLRLGPERGGSDILRRLVWAGAILAAVAVALVGIAFYGYTGVGVDQSGESRLVVELNREWLLSPGRLVRGVTAETTIDVRNSTFVPLYVPGMEHQLSIGGEPVGSPLGTPSMWLGPWDTDSVEVSTFIPRDELPGLILGYLVSGGNIDISVESTGEVAGYSISRTQTVPFTVANPVVSIRSS